MTESPVENAYDDEQAKLDKDLSDKQKLRSDIEQLLKEAQFDMYVKMDVNELPVIELSKI